MLTISSLPVSHNTVLHPLEFSDVFSPDFHACRASEMLLTTSSAEHFRKLFVELTLHFTEITSTYRALTTSITHFKSEAHFQCAEMLNHECNCTQMSQH